jgi:hypothetical protein
MNKKITVIARDVENVFNKIPSLHVENPEESEQKEHTST